MGAGDSFLWGPVVALLVVGVLALVLRWAYSGRRDSLLSRRPRRGNESAYGLLVPIASPATAAEGVALREALQTAGVRAALVATESGLRVMVWRDDLPRARALLDPDGPPGS